MSINGIDWAGLLNWSTKYHDGTKPSEFKQMSEEDRKFLEAAMEEAFGQVEDPNKVMEEAINKIKSPDRTDEVICTSLEVIDRCCDDPDCARNAEKLDGIQPLLDLLGTHSGAIRVRTCEILALFLSNNPKIQEAFMKRGGLPLAVELFRSVPAGSEERMKAFRLISAIVRNVQEYEEKFLSLNGLEIIVQSLDEAEDVRLREKACMLVRSFAQDGRLKPQDTAAPAQALGKLFRTVGKEGMQYREGLAACACELASLGGAALPNELALGVQARIDELRREPSDDRNELDILSTFPAFGASPAAAA
eukprot:gnl/TRDRNA2_/TRDRNA2_194663_c0_seq1.p1 gnl/TRDRNA2_/TRDRNA2_194663_c0~~gnl/TRDRNA2_/TRDRNA2_194663_c0_seq1.p1  ORF type:complete len:306 (-),score=72.99 gnl/TRDRNA2_/TRDRNA2_194663_c0_seq1:73-990(-)